MIKYIIPGMYEHYKLNFIFLEYMKQKPQYFYDNIEIAAVYGNPQFCIWDGGRIFNNYRYAVIEDIQEIITTYNYKYNIPIRYVFTNNLLNKEHYYNRFGNLLMEAGNNYNNEVVLADDNFMVYLQEKYPNYSFISSTTKCLLNKEKVKTELNNDNFKMVCLDYNLNNNLTFLNTLTEKEKKKTELLINPVCPPNCQNRKDHYYLNSKSNLDYGREYKMEYCGIIENNFHPEVIKKNHLTYEELKNTYEPMGFEYYKIEGRTWKTCDMLLTYCNYMVKPEYKDFVFCNIYNECLKNNSFIF